MTLPDNAPSWLVAIFFASVALGSLGKTLSETSDTAMKLLGPLGRYWRDRGVARTARNRARRADHREDEDAQIADLTRQVEFLKTRVAELEHVGDYLAYDATWHRVTKVYMKEEGWNLPAPDHLTFSEWRTQQPGGTP